MKLAVQSVGLDNNYFIQIYYLRQIKKCTADGRSSKTLGNCDIVIPHRTSIVATFSI